MQAVPWDTLELYKNRSTFTGVELGVGTRHTNTSLHNLKGLIRKNYKKFQRPRKKNHMSCKNAGQVGQRSYRFQYTKFLIKPRKLLKTFRVSHRLLLQWDTSASRVIHLSYFSLQRLFGSWLPPASVCNHPTYQFFLIPTSALTPNSLTYTSCKLALCTNMP